MNGPRDDDYDNLRDLMGDPAEDPGDDSGEGPGKHAGGDRDPESGHEPASGAPSDEGSADVDLPPGLPPEYAEAYRAGYERARHEEESGQSDEPAPGEGSSGVPTSGDAEATAAIPMFEDPSLTSPGRADPASASVPTPPAPPADAPAPGHEPTRQIEVGQVPPPVPPSATPAPSPAPASSAEPVAPTYDEEGEQRRGFPFVPALIVLAVILVVAAFGIGRLLADNAAENDSEAGGSGGSGSGGQGTPYEGSVQPATIAGATASCQARGSVDAAGNPTSYEPANAFDQDLTTAWRCAGSGRGQRLTFTLPAETKIAEVGLVPGYAKTDPVSGADRYAQNNRITRVRWRFDDGSTVVQRMGGSAKNRSMRTMRIAPTSTRKVVLEILGSRRGPRNTVAISEVRLASPAG